MQCLEKDIIKFRNGGRVKSLKRFNENYACFMLSLFCLIPMFALFSPQSFGPIFTTISYIELASLILLGLFQLISYASFETRNISAVDRVAICLRDAKEAVLNNKTGLMLIIVYIISWIAVLGASDLTRALKGTEFRPDGIFMYTSFSVIFIYASLVKSKKHRRIIFGINIAGFILCSIVLIQQYYGIIGTAGVKESGEFGRYLMDIYDEKGIRTGHFFKGLTGPFYNLNHMGYYIMINSMLISAFVIISESWKTKLAFSLLAAYSYYILIINDTFGCFVAVALALIIIPIAILLKFRKSAKKLLLNSLIPLALFVVVALGFIAFETTDNVITRNFKTFTSDVKEVATSEDLTEGEAGSGRIPLWIATLDMISERPIFGYGPDNLKAHYVERDQKVDRAHNEPLECAVANGLPAALIYYIGLAWGIICFMKRRFTKYDKDKLIAFAMLVGYLISSFFGVFLFYTAGFFIIALAFVCSDGFAKFPPEAQKEEIKHKKH